MKLLRSRRGSAGCVEGHATAIERACQRVPIRSSGVVSRRTLSHSEPDSRLSRDMTSTDSHELVRPDALLTITQVSNRLGVSVRHVRRLVFEHRIPYVKWGHLVRFDPAEIERWIDGSRTPIAALSSPASSVARRAGPMAIRRPRAPSVAESPRALRSRHGPHPKT